MNMLAVDKRKVSLALRISTIAKIDKMAAMAGLSRNAYVGAVLDDKTAGVTLTEEEMKEIQDEIDRNIARRK